MRGSTAFWLAVFGFAMGVFTVKYLDYYFMKPSKLPTMLRYEKQIGYTKLDADHVIVTYCYTDTVEYDNRY